MRGVPDTGPERGDVVALAERLPHAGHRGDVHGLGEALGGGLVAEHLELRGSWPDEVKTFGLARPRKQHVLGQEPVAGVNGVGPAPLRDPDDLVNIEICADRFSTLGRTDRVGLVGFETM